VDNRVDLAALAARLGQEKLISTLSEAGPVLSAALVAADLADELVLYVAPIVIGGEAPAWIGGAGVAEPADAWAFDVWRDPIRVGDDLKLELRRAPTRKHADMP
jgi:diaminohydroxyphosphoribosylaminopyrimidine deaminase/5-amino-6-(5-phosphoribosylamino)uracil reductase